MAGMSDYLENKLIDYVFRGQPFVPPTNLYVALYTTGSADNGAGRVEVSGGSYSRAVIASSMANWAGTQGAGTTVASSGVSGTTSNNVAITFPAPTAAWGSIVAIGIYDAATSGNELWYGSLSTPKTINAGDPAQFFSAAGLSIQIDN